MQTVDILGVPFLNGTMDQLVELLDHRLAHQTPTFMVTANPEIMMYALKNPSYYQLLQDADIVIPDGIGIVIGSKMLGTPIQERLAGYDLTLCLFDLAAKKGYKVYFLGAKPEVVEEAAKKMKDRYTSLDIVGYHHGYFHPDDESIIADIKRTSPDIILVGLGYPKQEQWIDRYRKRLAKGLMIGVGGTFDGLAGVVPRAPKIWRKLNLEWFYRLIQQPTRWKRMLVIPAFIARVWWERGKKSPS